MPSRILALTVLASVALAQTASNGEAIAPSVYLNSHNQQRTLYGVGNLTDIPSLQADTEAYAAKCVFAHSGLANYGENIAACASSGGYPCVGLHDCLD